MILVELDNLVHTVYFTFKTIDFGLVYYARFVGFIGKSYKIQREYEAYCVRKGQWEGARTGLVVPCRVLE